MTDAAAAMAAIAAAEARAERAERCALIGRLYLAGVLGVQPDTLRPLPDRAPPAWRDAELARLHRALLRLHEWADEAVEYANNPAMSPSLERQGREAIAEAGAALTPARWAS